jgi:Transposase DDE domain
VGQLAEVLDSPEIAALVSQLEATRWTGRPGYPIRPMVGMALAKSIYAVPTWTRLVALVSEHATLRAVITGATHDVPSVYACYRFTAKLRAYSDLLAQCIHGATASLAERVPQLGRNVAIDGSDMPAYANGQRYVSMNGPERERYSDPDASWGHRSAVSTRKGGGFYGYKIDALVCTATDLPLAWDVRTARDNESIHVLPLIDTGRARGFAVETCAMDKGYDLTTVYDGCDARDVRRSSRCARRLASSAATTSRRRASTASGRSPEPTASGRRPSGAARQVSVSPPQRGSRLAALTPSSRARHPAGRLFTVAALPSSASSAASSRSGRCHRSACGASSGFGCTPT